MKLYRVEVETELYCLAESAKDAEQLARQHYRDEEIFFSTEVANYIDSDWDDAIPYHNLDTLTKTCAECLLEFNNVN